MKKLLVSLLIGVSVCTMVGCNEKQVNDVIDSIPTVEENAETQRLGSELYHYAEEDYQIFRRFKRTQSIEELQDDLAILREHFRNRLNADDMLELYQTVDGITESQKEFFKEYYKFCEEMSKFKVKLPTDMCDEEGLARVERAVEAKHRKLAFMYSEAIDY